MALFEKYPALRRALVNQYQVILLGGAAAFSVLTASGLPLLLFAGLNLMALPFLLERLKKRIEIEKKYAARQAETMSQEAQYDDLPGALRQRFAEMRKLCERVQANYRGLSPESQNLLAEQATKFDAILGSYLKRLWLLRKYEEMVSSTDFEAIRADIVELERAVADDTIAPRVREALEKNLDIKKELFSTLEGNAQANEALHAEIDSLEALLQLLLQKSVAATDAAAFSVEIDDVLHQVQADARSVEEMERMLGAVPSMQSAPALSPKLRQAMSTPPPPPPTPNRQRQR